MESTLRRTSLEETYKDVENLIYTITWKFQNKYGGIFEELRAEANLLFVIAFDSYDPKKARFSTWLFHNIWNGLLTYKQTIHKQTPYTHYSKEESYSFQETEDKQNSFIRTFEILDELREDTKTITQLILDPPESFTKITPKKGESGCHTRVAIRQYLSSLGWTARQIRESFAEITEVISG